MNKDTEIKILNLIKSDELKQKITDTKTEFSEEDLLLIINACAQTFDECNSLFEEFSLSAQPQLADYAKKCITTYQKQYEDFKVNGESEYYMISINWDKNDDGFDYPHNERYFAGNFDDILKFITNFYRHSHLAGTNKRQNAVYAVYKFTCDEVQKNLPFEDRDNVDENYPMAFFNSDKKLVSIYDDREEFPMCQFEDHTFSLCGHFPLFPNVFEKGDLLKLNSFGPKKYFVVADNDEVVNTIQAINLDNDEVIQSDYNSLDDLSVYCEDIFPPFAKKACKEELPSYIAKNYNVLLSKIK